MKKRRIWVSTFGALVLVAGALIGASSAAAETVSQTTVITYANTNFCTGEEFTGTGNVTFTESSTLGTDGLLHNRITSRIDGLKAYTITGKKYVVQDTFFEEMNDVGAGEDTFRITAHYIRQGEDGTFILGDDFYQVISGHITANSAGMVTAFSYNVTEDPCQ